MSDATTETKTPQPAAALPAGAAPGGARPSVISLAIREKAALYAAYMPFVHGGGIFVPTTRHANLGDDLYLILTLLEDTTKFAVPGKVAWITPPGSTGRQQGLGIQFAKTEAGEQVRAKIEELIGGALKSSRPTHTI
jgi:type IV pilus assembly protein PilZ